MDYHRCNCNYCENGGPAQGGNCFLGGYSERVGLIAYCRRQKNGRVYDCPPVPSSPAQTARLSFKITSDMRLVACMPSMGLPSTCVDVGVQTLADRAAVIPGM